jgi:hypothetical protein
VEKNGDITIKINNYTPVIVILDKTTKESYLTDLSIPTTFTTQSPRSSRTVLTDNKANNMPTDNCRYNTNSDNHKWYYSVQITRNFKTAQSSPCTIHSNADGSNN